LPALFFPPRAPETLVKAGFFLAKIRLVPRSFSEVGTLNFDLATAGLPALASCPAASRESGTASGVPPRASEALCEGVPPPNFFLAVALAKAGRVSKAGAPPICLNK